MKNITCKEDQKTIKALNMLDKKDIIRLINGTSICKIEGFDNHIPDTLPYGIWEKGEILSIWKWDTMELGGLRKEKLINLYMDYRIFS